LPIRFLTDNQPRMVSPIVSAWLPEIDVSTVVRKGRELFYSPSPPPIDSLSIRLSGPFMHVSTIVVCMDPTRTRTPSPPSKVGSSFLSGLAPPLPPGPDLAPNSRAHPLPAELLPHSFSFSFLIFVPAQLCADVNRPRVSKVALLCCSTPMGGKIPSPRLV